MIESPSTSLVTTCLFIFSFLLPLALVYQLWLYYRHKTATTKTSIPEVICLKRLNDTITVEKPINEANKSVSLISSVQYAPKDMGRKTNATSRPYAGEDAFFSYTPMHSSNLVGAMGIADGVGGYADIGVDAGLMAWQLMENSRDNFISSAETNTELYKNPRNILSSAFDTIHKKQQVACGGTTACLVSIFKDQDEGLYLQYANLGDSGFMVVRDGEVIFRTIDQTHYFNAPYQLAIPPRGKTVIMNNPLDSSQFEAEQYLKLQVGDYIVLATDGLWDNIFDEDVVDCLTLNACQYSNKADVIEKTTRDLLMKTSSVSRNIPRAVVTPFERYAIDNRKNWSGGKVDDISIMISCIVPI